MPSSRRSYCRRAVGLLAVGAGCGSRPTAESSAGTGERQSTRTTDHTDSRSSTTDESERETESATRSTTAVVFHDVEAEDLPRRARVGVLSPDVWEWVTTAVETGAVDVGVEDGWTPTFPSTARTTATTPTSTPVAPDSRAPRVDLALGAADVLVVDGDPYAIRVVYSGEASSRLKTKPVGSIEQAEPPEATDTVATVSALPPAQRRIAREAVENETGYYVGYHDRTTEAFETVRGYDYLQYEGETYWTYVAHGDSFFVHTTLWAEPVDGGNEEDVVFDIEPVELSERGRAVVTEAIRAESGAASVETVPSTLAAAAETFDALATTTGLYVVRVR